MTVLLEVLPISLRFIAACNVQQNPHAVTSKAIITTFFLNTSSFHCGAVDIKQLY